MQAQWIIVDSEPNRSDIRLLQKGDKRLTGRSVRKNLNQTQRMLLLGRLEEAGLRGIKSDTLAEAQGTTWHVLVVPVLSPWSNQPVGAYGTYVEEGHLLPEPPKIGALEWHVSQERQIFWDKVLTELYGMEQQDLVVLRGPAGEVYQPPRDWLTRWVEATDQDRIQHLVATAVNARTSSTGVISYTIIHPESRQEKVLELAASNSIRDDGAMVIYGMTREVVEAAGSKLPEELLEPTPKTDALIDMTADIPLAKVDMISGEPVQVFPGWNTSELPNLREVHLFDLIEKGRRAELEEIVGDGMDPQPVQVIERAQFRTAQGGYVLVDLWVKSVGDGQVMVRLKLV